LSLIKTGHLSLQDNALFFVAIQIYRKSLEIFTTAIQVANKKSRPLPDGFQILIQSSLLLGEGWVGQRLMTLG
jgi:hypothetical protein